MSTAEQVPQFVDHRPECRGEIVVAVGGKARWPAAGRVEGRQFAGQLDQEREQRLGMDVRSRSVMGDHRLVAFST